MSPSHPLVREHITAGGRGVVLEQGIKGQMITIYDHGAHIPLLWTHLVPATLEGRATHNVQNAMFAAAMAFSMGVKLEDIRHGLRTFQPSFFQAPGRMNVFDEHPFKVIVDYGHNAPAVDLMAQLAQRLDVAGRRLVVLAAPGDRRDQDILDIARAAAGRFDHYVCRRDDRPRGRGHDEVPKLLREGLLANGVPADRIDVLPDEREAHEHALRLAQPGDLVLLFADALTRTWKQVINFRSDAPPSPVERTRPAPLAVPDLPPVEVPSLNGDALVRDERGVRLARETED
jgi:cyanophycin synthetase